MGVIIPQVEQTSLSPGQKDFMDVASPVTKIATLISNFPM